MIIKTPGSFDGIAEGYDFIASLSPERNEFFLNRLTDRRTAALDVGCGSGILASELADHYARVVGIDISTDMLRIARTKRPRPNVTYLQMDANAIELDGPFDLICSINTFHHLTDLSAALDRLKRLLAPGGRLVITDCVLLRFAWLKPYASRHPWVYFAGAVLNAPGNVRRMGWKNAIRAFRHQASQQMREHLADDEWLKPNDFREVYGARLPGCEFHNPAGGGMAVVWDAPTEAPHVLENGRR